MLRGLADLAGVSSQVTAALADTYQGRGFTRPGMCSPIWPPRSPTARPARMGLASCGPTVSTCSLGPPREPRWAVGRRARGVDRNRAAASTGREGRGGDVGGVVSALFTKEPSQIKLSTLIALCTALQCTPNDLFEIDTTPFEPLASLRRGRFCRSRRQPTRGAGRCRRCRFGLFWNWLRPMGKRQRDCIDCGAPVKYLGREHCCGWMRRLRDHAAKTHCPACGRDRVLVPGSAAAAGSAFM